MKDDKLCIFPDALIAMIVTEAQDRALAQMPGKRSQPGGCGRGLFIACFAGLFHFCKAVFHHLQIAQDELGVDGFDIAHRVHTALHMYDVCAVKTAHHMHKRVAFADISKKFIA